VCGLVHADFIGPICPLNDSRCAPALQPLRVPLAPTLCSQLPPGPPYLLREGCVEDSRLPKALLQPHCRPEHPAERDVLAGTPANGD
jgi:hypothetical protein